MYNVHDARKAKFVSVDGQWGSWQVEACPVTCNGSSQLKTRSCNSPPPQHGGNNCTGPSSEVVACNTQSCPSIVCSDIVMLSMALLFYLQHAMIMTLPCLDMILPIYWMCLMLLPASSTVGIPWAANISLGTVPTLQVASITSAP